MKRCIIGNSRRRSQALIRVLLKAVALLLLLQAVTGCREEEQKQEQEARFPSYQRMEGFQYRSDVVGDLRLFLHRSVAVLQTSERRGPNGESYQELFRRYIQEELDRELGYAVDIDWHLPSLDTQNPPNLLARQWRSRELPPSREQLEQLSRCPLPELDLAVDSRDKAITSYLEWRILVTCELEGWESEAAEGASAEGASEEQRRIYSQYAKAQHYTNSLEFISTAIIRMLKRYYEEEMGVEEQMGLFERIFLVTQLRAMTQAEYNMASQLIASHSLLALVKEYILNWIISNRSKRWLNFATERTAAQMRHSVRVWGQVRDTAGDYLEGVQYEILDEHLRGYQTGGSSSAGEQRSAANPDRLDEDARPDGHSGAGALIGYNYALQYYLPGRAFHKGSQQDAEQLRSAYRTIRVRFSKPGYYRVTREIEVPRRHSYEGAVEVEPGSLAVVLSQEEERIIIGDGSREAIETTIPEVTVRGSVQGYSFSGVAGMTSLTYRFRGEEREASLDAERSFSIQLRVPQSREKMAYPLTLRASNEAGHALEAHKAIIYVPEYAPDQVVVRFQPSATEADIDQLVLELEGSIGDSHKPIKLYQIDLPAGSDALAVVTRLRSDNRVAYTLPNLYFPNLEASAPLSAGVVPDDPSYSNQEAYLSRIALRDAWGVTTGSTKEDEAAVVAVVDYTLNWRHADLAENIWQNLGEDCDGDGRTIEQNSQGQWQFDPGDTGKDCDGDGNFDDDGNGYVDDLVGWNFFDSSSRDIGNNDPSMGSFHHGTRVAGIIGAVGNNGRAIAGVNWNVEIMPLQRLGRTVLESGEFAGDNPVEVDEDGNVLKTFRAFAYASNMGADIINASFAGYIDVNDEMGARNFQALENLMKDINDPSVLYVIAAGNEGLDLTQDDGAFDCSNTKRESVRALGMRCLLFPQSLSIPNKIVVAATDNDDRLAGFSNYSPTEVDIAAPGENIQILAGLGEYIIEDSGTSFATPMVAGAASLVLARYPELRGQALLLKERLLAAADRLDGAGGSPDLTGQVAEGRRLNVYRAVGGGAAAADAPDLQLPDLPRLTVGNRDAPTVVERARYNIPGIPGNGTHLIACDIDGDGDKDMIVTGGNVPAHIEGDDLQTERTVLLVNRIDEEMGFVDETGERMEDIGLRNILGGDCGNVDRDRDNDIILASFQTYRGFGLSAPSNKNILLRNIRRAGERLLVDASHRLPDTYKVSRDADFIDIDGDGDLDIFFSNYREGHDLLLNDGDGYFSDISDQLETDTAGDAHNAHIADINGDGCPDIYVANQQTMDQLFVNRKHAGRCSGSFRDEAAARGLLAGDDGYSHEGAFADIDADGDLDLAVARRDSQRNLIYINDGSGYFQEEGGIRLLPDSRLSTSTLDVGDLTGDGCPDIIFGNGDLNTFEAYQDQLYINSRAGAGCSGEFVEVGATQPYSIYGLPMFINTSKDILFFDADNDGYPDVWFANFGEADLLLINSGTCHSGYRGYDC